MSRGAVQAKIHAGDKYDTMNVCIYVRALMKVYLYYYRSLKKEYDASLFVQFVAQNRREAEDVYRNVGNDANVIIVSEYFKQHWEEFSLDKLKRFEHAYDCSPVWSLIYADRYLIGKPWEYCIKIACGYFCLYDEIFKSRKYDFYVDETIAILSSYIAYTAAKGNGVDYCAQVLTRGFDAEGHYFTRDPMQYNCNFDKNYVDKSYPDEIRRKADGYISSLKKEYVKPVLMNETGKVPTFRIGFAKTPLVYLMRKSQARYNDKYDYIDYRKYEHVFDSAKFYFRYRSYRKYYKKPDYADKYVFFALHFQPEATTLVCAPKYEKQLFFIDQLAKSLPSDTKLYVKEHYAFLGHREPDFYTKLKQYGNVVLIDPLEQSKDLILHSEAVVTLTGTVGWEGMILGKPVIMAGKMFYQDAPGVMHVDDIYGNYVGTLAKWRKPGDRVVSQYLCEHLATMYKGCICAINPTFDNPANLEDLGDSLVEELRRRIGKRGSNTVNA